MPSSICSEPSCNKITKGGRCSKHRDTRGRDKSTFYGGRPWRRTRKLKLNLEPDCERCGQPANEVHHIKPRRECTHYEMYEIDNLESLCKPCHDAATKRGE